MADNYTRKNRLRVALRKESVDRNNDDFSVESGEMVVALRKESVDRNTADLMGAQ